MDARGNITSEKFGNGLTAFHNFHASTGLVKDVYFGAGPVYLQHFHYDYDDPFGNVTTRSNVVKGVDEVFTYDDLQRLKSSTRGGVVTNYEYDPIGNLLLKSDFAHDYAYGNVSRSLGGNAGPHAVRQVHHKDGTTFTFDYDDNGNMLSGLNRALIYDAFNKPTRIEENGVITDLAYAPDLRLYKRENAEQVIYYVSGDYEKVIDKGTGKVSGNSYLSNNVAVEKDEDGRKLRFMHHDRLTSITAITDRAGTIIEERGFDAFGAPLDAEWKTNGALLNGDFSDRGFTSHKHMDEHKVIHMDGRLYDPLLGRFFSVDPIIHDPKNTQSQNAYTYVMNNPLSMIDPTGYAPEDRIVESEKLGGAQAAPVGADSAKNNGKKGRSGHPVDQVATQAVVDATDKVTQDPEATLKRFDQSKDDALLKGRELVERMIEAMNKKKKSKAENDEYAKWIANEDEKKADENKPEDSGENLTPKAAGKIGRSLERTAVARVIWTSALAARNKVQAEMKDKRISDERKKELEKIEKGLERIQNVASKRQIRESHRQQRNYRRRSSWTN